MSNQKCEMKYPKMCTGVAEVLNKDIQGGPKWMCRPCDKEYYVEQDEVYEAFKHNTRGVYYGKD